MNLDIGIIGAGNFAMFAADAFTSLPDVKIVAVTDINHDAAKILGDKFGAVVSPDLESFLANEKINLVYIATPPWLHYTQSRAALQSGKHVICEKPAALHAVEARELSELARAKNLLWVVNLMQPYNPLYQMVSTIVEEKLAGSFLHGFFENYASDENLPAGHWFWDKEKSGGIFIEHAVHFFDMFEGWLGKGKLLHAFELLRPGNSEQVADRVQATVLYAEGPVNFYHGFDQPKIMDRQQLRLQFERAEITLEEWVPVRMNMKGLLADLELQRIQQICPGINITHSVDEPGSVKGRFKEINYSTNIEMNYEDPAGKQHRYRELLRDMLADQRQWIRDRQHQRTITDMNAIHSLTIAEQASLFAKENCLK